MAQPLPDEQITLDQVLKLVDRLTPEEQERLREDLSNRSWGQRFQRLCDRIEATRIAKGLPRLTEEEILTEVKAVREQMKDRRGNQSGG